MAKILILENSKIDQLIYQKMLSERFDISFAANLADFYEELGKASPDLVILDLDLPDGDGFSVCEKIKLQDTKLPVFIISAHNNIETQGFSAQVGAEKFFSKPVKSEELLNAISSSLAFS